MKIARLVKIVSIAFSILLLLVLAPVIFLLTIDPNDYKPEIETLALEQGVDLQIRGDLGWQIYPSIALELNDVALSTEQPGMSLMAGLDLAQLNINLWPLFSGELSVRAINVRGVDLSITETASQRNDPEAQTGSVNMNLPRLNVQGISLADLNILYQPQTGDAIQLAIAELRAQQFNIEGTPFPFGLELDLDYSGQNLNLGMESRLTLDLEAQHYRLETEGLVVGIAGDQDVSSQIDLIADVNMASGNWQLSLDSMQVDDLFAQLQAEGLMEPLRAQGNLSLEGGAGFIGRITNTDMINNLALETGFDYSSEALLLNSLTATVNETEIEAGLEYFLEGQNTSQLRIDIGQVNLDQYLPAEQEQTDTPASQNPLAFLESVPPFAIQLSVDELLFSGYQLTDLQMNSDIADSRAVVSLQHAGFAEGDIEANLVLQATDQPQVQIGSFRANNIQLGQLVMTEAGEPLVQGEATAAFNGELASLSGEDYLSGLNGDGLVSVDGLYLRNWNIEQNICVSAERLGATAALQSTWPAGTELSAFSSPVRIRNGVATLEGITSGFGNISFTGGGDLNLVSMDLSAQLALLIQGDRTSEQGCPVNSYIRNTELPLSCEGNIGEGGEMSCGLDNAVVQALLSGRVQNAIQERLERFLGTPDEGQEEEAEEVEDPTRQLFQEALRGILRPNPR